jgi:hypothetical protein
MCVDGRITLKQIFKKYVVRVWTALKRVSLRSEMLQHQNIFLVLTATEVLNNDKLVSEPVYLMNTNHECQPLEHNVRCFGLIFINVAWC